MKELVEKKAVIDMVAHSWGKTLTSLCDEIRKMPPTEPEVVRCQDCIHGVGPDHNLRCNKYYSMGEYDGFCSRGYRRSHA